MQHSASSYEELVLKAGLADYSETRGSMIIRPYGYAIWELIRDALDKRIKETGHQNAYFPLLIPKSLLDREAAHVADFAKQCAVVTHYRLKKDQATGRLIPDPEAKLDEELIVRPTSEAIIWPAFGRWIKSYRDLPLMLNNWANIVRWEMRTRLFLRTTEFLWQECHTAHETEAEARAETLKMLGELASIIRDHLAIPVLPGQKTEAERFAGAEDTYTIEALLQDGKALQAGTSHFFGTNFSKAYGVQFTGRDGQQHYAWGTTWGVTTRLIGALVLSHSDERGLVLPPRVAPVQLVIIPTFRSPEILQAIDALAAEMIGVLRKKGLRAAYDNDPQLRPGKKYTAYELQGVPLRITLGAAELSSGRCTLIRRDSGEQIQSKQADLAETVSTLLAAIQDAMYRRAAERIAANTSTVDSYEAFRKAIKEQRGFIRAHWDGTTETELRIKAETGATIRCRPLDEAPEPGSCMYSGKPSAGRVYFARAH